MYVKKAIKYLFYAIFKIKSSSFFFYSKGETRTKTTTSQSKAVAFKKF